MSFVTCTLFFSLQEACQKLHTDEMGESTGGRVARANVPIPKHLWEMILPSGQYIKSIMEYMSYGYIDSACFLKDPNVLNKMFEDAAEVYDGVEDKAAMYGPFAAKPEKLFVLPGLQKRFRKFIHEIEILNNNAAASAEALKRPSCRKRPSKDVLIEDIRGQIQDWLQQKGITRLYRVINSNNNFTFVCLHCHWKTILVIHEDTACLNHVCSHITNHCIVHASVNVPETDASSSSSVKWNSRSFRNREKLLRASMEPDQTKITEFFDIDTFSSSVNDIVFIRKKVNETLGAEEDMTIAPMLKLLYSNALNNAKVKSKSGCRHEDPVKMFAAYMFCLIGKAGYEFIQSNVGVALPSLPTIMRMISKFPRIREGEFMFDEVAEHLEKWKAPKYVHVHMDDTRVINKIEYDQATDGFTGFVLPLEKGLPTVNAFILCTFDELKTSFETSPVANYAHVIVAKPLTAEAPSFVFFVLGTDSKYDHKVILDRWSHIETELGKRDIKVISFGADGAGSFMKAMLIKTGLFYPTEDLFAKSYVMKEIATTGLSAQDHIHLLAKLRTRLLIPSNILALGDETACLEHIKYILRNYSKEKHQLTERIVSNKDKQNYGGIEILLSEGVFDCLNKSKPVMENLGTITYLTLMRDIRDSFLDKSLQPAVRLCRIWKVVFFLRIWRRWLRDHGRSEKDHFITNNAYVCVEINAHLMLQIVSGVIKGQLPREALRFWLTGSQGCEEIFRLARSMTSTFSTIVNFSMKGILERMHKLNFLSTMECSNDITFPRVQRRLLQCQKEGEQTFAVFPHNEIDTLIQGAKDEAKRMASDLGMVLQSDEDSYILSDVIHVLAKAVEEDEEDEEYSEPTISTESTHDDPDRESELILIQEDLVSLRLSKSSTSGLPVYDLTSTTKGTVKSKTYALQRKNKSPFLLYGDRYIRKSTALYLLQENMSLSSDRLLRVRKKQLSHIHNPESDAVYPENHIKTCDLCLFKRVDDQRKFAIGRVLQFSYMRGSKKEREFSSDYVDFDADAEMSYIGAFCNWYVGEEKDSEIGFILSYNYAQGYLSLDNYVMKIPDSQVAISEEYAFIIRKEYLDTCIDDYNKVL